MTYTHIFYFILFYSPWFFVLFCFHFILFLFPLHIYLTIYYIIQQTMAIVQTGTSRLGSFSLSVLEKEVGEEVGRVVETKTDKSKGNIVSRQQQKLDK